MTGRPFIENTAHGGAPDLELACDRSLDDSCTEQLLDALRIHAHQMFSPMRGLAKNLSRTGSLGSPFYGHYRRTPDDGLKESFLAMPRRS
jgi:hypothetical protein